MSIGYESTEKVNKVKNRDLLTLPLNMQEEISGKCEIKDEKYETRTKRARMKSEGRRKVSQTVRTFRTSPPTIALRYKIPLSIYERYMNEMTSNPNKIPCIRRLRCHQVTYETFNTTETPNCRANILVAARQAFENRDFKTLTEILEKALKIRDMLLKQQVLAYMDGEHI